MVSIVTLTYMFVTLNLGNRERVVDLLVNVVESVS